MGDDYFDYSSPDGGGGDYQPMALDSSAAAPYAAGGGGGDAGAPFIDVRFAEIPEHLRYKPMQVPNTYKGVKSRLLEPRKPLPNVAKIEPLKSPHAPNAFAGVHPRYLEPRTATPPPVRSLVMKPEDVPDLKLHRSVSAKLGFGAVPSRLLDWRNRDDDVSKSPQSPRRITEKHREENKRSHGFRIGSVAPSMTFDDHRRRNQRLIELMKRKSKLAPSPIALYVTQNIAIHHHTMGPHYVSPKRTKEEAAAEESAHTKWVPNGGSGGGSWNRRPNSPRKNSLVRIENDLKHHRTQSARSVSPSFVPRVATLTPSHSLMQWEASMRSSGAPDEAQTVASPGDASHARGRDAAATTPPHPQHRNHAGALSPEYAPTPDARLTSEPRGRPLSPSVVASPGRDRPLASRDGSVFVGPVTLAVPAGAVVRVKAE